MARFTAAARSRSYGTMTAVVLFTLAFSACAEEAANTGEPATDGASESASLRIPGFQTPESVLHDAAGDVYLVSNVFGAPLDKDDNGFISRVSPEGEIVDLRWIDGADDAVTLHAPKGTAIRGDTLFVSDIDVVRLFHRQTGEPLGNWPVSGAAFLNDADIAPDGALYITDTGMGTEGAMQTVYRFENGEPAVVAQGSALSGPNGVVADDRGVIIAPFSGDEVYSLDDTGQPTMLVTLPAGQLDGLVRLDDGSILVSSWEGQVVYHATPGGAVTVAVDSVPAPADIGYDSRRGRVLIPLFQANEVLVRTVP